MNGKMTTLNSEYESYCWNDVSLTARLGPKPQFLFCCLLHLTLLSSSLPDLLLLPYPSALGRTWSPAVEVSNLQQLLLHEHVQEAHAPRPTPKQILPRAGKLGGEGRKGLRPINLPGASGLEIA